MLRLSVGAALLGMAGLVACAGNDADCRQASQACASGFECKKTSSDAYECVPESATGSGGSGDSGGGQAGAGGGQGGSGGNALSDCGQQVLKDSQGAFTTCHTKTVTFGSCATCGYAANAMEIQSANDCIACEAGFEIDVRWGDCTGYCVPQGTASTPLATSDCVPPGTDFTKIHTSCFDGALTATACETCGYYEKPSDALNPDDCITCPSGYELNVEHDDCTGFCVPTGSALTPIASASCTPLSSCVK